MTEREFLGWDGPFLGRAAVWLTDRREALPHTLALVPTSQAGRRLREALAEHAGGALLSPKIATPGALLRTPEPTVAADWMERLAWIETLEAVTDWEPYRDLFPESPVGEGDWSGGLAAELGGLRHALQENGLTLGEAARRLGNTVEAGRWAAMAQLEKPMERLLGDWGLQSRSRVLAGGVHLPQGITSVVLAGITDVSPLLEKALLAWSGPVTALIAAPAGEAEGFSPLGIPLESWTQRPLPWPDGEWGRVRLVADPRQEAAEALRAVADHQPPSNEVALGTADRETGDELARVFTRAGWTAFHPAAQTVASGFVRWLRVWSAWLADPTLATLADLLALPETSILMQGNRAIKASLLASLRNEWMVVRAADLRHRLGTAKFRSEQQRDNAEEVMRTAATLENRRAAFLEGDFVQAMGSLLGEMAAGGADAAQVTAFTEWLHHAAPLVRRTGRDPVFWIRLMLEDHVPAPPPPPDGRVIDVLGWLELLYEPGRHLVLCGMNEGKVPARGTSDPFLGEAARKALGLTRDADRAARDAFLYQAMLEARRRGGRVDVFCAKSGTGGEALLPSRLLLAADREDLPSRVRELFQPVEPPEAGMRWQNDWKWRPRAVETAPQLRVTSFATWISCPFRFHLKHMLRMQTTEPARVEWNARDFGSVCHEILERWALDPAARGLEEPQPLHDWLSAVLDETTRNWFGSQAPLAVRLQTESLRQRLVWFARQQASLRAQGWETIAVETPFEIALGPAIVRGTYDRLDRHRESGELRVIDYKTGKVDAVEKEHRTRIVAATRLPAHIPEDSPVLHHAGEGAAHRWINLQLPLYALALRQSHGLIPTPCYFQLGATEAQVKLDEWSGFGASDLLAAADCAEWIAGRIAAGVFWPPAEKPVHDDFAVLAAGRTLAEMCEPAARP
jgi:ATP-dependent helicase/nuclease subunit B